MNWISNYVRPKINSLFSRREVPENLWTKCPECGTMLFHRELADNLNVCTSCDHHMAITPRDRFGALFDGGIFTEVKVPDALVDPLHFRDQKKYPDRLKSAQKTTGEKEAMLVAEGEIARTPIVAVAQDFSFMAGSMGMYVGNAMIDSVIPLLRPGGRIVISGQLADYNAATGDVPGITNTRYFIASRLRMEGLVVFDDLKGFPAAQEELGAMIERGEVKVREHRYQIGRAHV